MAALVMKKCCQGCPYDVGMPATEEAYNLGCLPSIPEVNSLCRDSHTAWACHSAPGAVCAGFAEMNPGAIQQPLQHMVGVHSLTDGAPS